MLYFDRIESLFAVSGIAVGPTFDVVLLEQLVASVLNSDFAVIP